MIFWFHLAILILVSVLLLHELYRAKKKGNLVTISILLALFIFHCVFWGSGCTVCDLSNPICAIELLLFWIVVLIVAVTKYKEIRGR